jgi:hypothetical protein
VELAQLKELIKVLRSNGVQQFSTPELTLVLNDEAPPSKYKRKQSSAPAPEDERELTEEELLFYSAAGIPIHGSDDEG